MVVLPAAGISRTTITYMASGAQVVWKNVGRILVEPMAYKTPMGQWYKSKEANACFTRWFNDMLRSRRMGVSTVELVTANRMQELILLL